MNAPMPLSHALNSPKQSIDLCTGSFDQRMVAECCAWHTARAVADVACRVSGQALMQAALTEHLSNELHWTPPRGGFFLWTRLPEGLDAVQLLPIAQQHGVIYVTGDAFFVDGRGTEFIRLAFSAPSHERIHEGVQRLARRDQRGAVSFSNNPESSTATR